MLGALPAAAPPGCSRLDRGALKAAEELRCSGGPRWVGGSGDARLRGEVALPRLRWLLMRCSSMWCTGTRLKCPWCVPRAEVAPATPSSVQPRQAARSLFIGSSRAVTGTSERPMEKRPLIEAA